MPRSLCTVGTVNLRTEYGKAKLLKTIRDNVGIIVNLFIKTNRLGDYLKFKGIAKEKKTKEKYIILNEDHLRAGKSSGRCSPVRDAEDG